tara:strand:+ start:2457 stop:2828 length:372 start_codon:yes stop_codon:yes gene_type:complete
MCPSNSIRKKNPLKEFWTEERCYITELLNNPQSPNISIALARVEIDITTQLHSLRGVQETYIIKKGLGLLEIDNEQISVKENDTILIEANRSQRITNVGNCDLEFYCICIPRFYTDCYINLED